MQLGCIIFESEVLRMSKLTDILSLIKSGYSKKEIEELYKNEVSAPVTPVQIEPQPVTPLTKKTLVDNTTVEEINNLINGFKTEVENLRKTQQSINRNNLSGVEPKPETVDDILSSILDSENGSGK